MRSPGASAGRYRKAPLPSSTRSTKRCLPPGDVGLRIPLCPDAAREADAEADLLCSGRVEVDDGRLALEDRGAQPQLVAAARVDKGGERVLLVIHAVQGDAVRAGHRQER